MSISSSSSYNMFGVVSDDILEKILVRLDVEDLIRCKSVCKSWQSFISASCFVKSHLNYSYKKDRYHVKYKYFHRRIVMSQFGQYNSDNLIGSSNGLVCISPSLSQVLVANPSTRQFVVLQELEIPSYYFLQPTVFDQDLPPLCSGFGYDSSTDDYKLIFGFTKSIEKNLHFTYFQVLTLKSNVWKYVGHVKYACVTRMGTFCNGAIHWVMIDQSDRTVKQKVVISFSLSNEEFKTIATPPHVQLDSCFYIKLGVFDECLCIYNFTYPRSPRWLLKTYSWVPLEFDHRTEFDTVHYFNELHNWSPDKTITSFTHDSAPIFVRSLVSPHHYFNNARLKRKMPFE